MIAQSGTPRNGAGPDLALRAERTKHAIEWAPTRPVPLPLRPDNIPLELQRRPQWVAWRYELAAGKDSLKRWTKVPTIARRWSGAEPGGNAKSTDPATWTTLGNALFYHYERNDSDGISYAFSADDPFCGVDLDDSIDPATGNLRDWARPIVADLDSYTEVSPSGTGVKIFLEGAVPGPRRKKGDVEMYDTARFFTVTGHHLPGTPETVNHRPDALRRLYVQTFGSPRPAPSPKSNAPATPLPLPATSGGVGPADDELIQLATTAPNGAKFVRLWAGDWSGYESQSGADLALCATLAYWCRRDTARMDALFRKSGLYRALKWNRRSYREPTIRKAVEGCVRVRSSEYDLPFTPEELAVLAPLVAQLDPPDAPTPVVRPAPACEFDKLRAAEEAATVAAQPQAVVWAGAVDCGPGVYIDQDPHAYPAHVVRGTVTLAGVRRSLTVVRSGREAEDTAATLGVGDGSGLRVAAYPKRGSDNCANLEEVKQVESIGLSAGAAVCPTCAFNMLGECPFQKAMNEAKEADHRVVTSARATGGLADLARDVEAVFVLRDALDVLAPHAGVGGLRREHLTTLASAAARAATKAWSKGRPAVWWVGFRQTAEEIATRLAAGKPAAVPMPPVKKPPPLWGATMWNLLRGTHGRPPRIPPGLICLIASAVTGRLRSLDLLPEDGSLRLVGVWHPRLPPNATVLAVEVLATTALAGVGMTTTDITTAVPPAWTTRAVQVPQRRTAKQRPGSAAALLRGFLAAHPGEHLCVLLPGRCEQAEDLAGEILTLLAPDEVAHVALVPWHGPAPGSPSALPSCDRIIGLGIPAVPPGSVRRRLIQCGDGDAARADGDWGERAWSRPGADGIEVRVRERGYRHAAWHAAYRAVVQDLLRRRLVGAAVPVVLVTDLELGLPLGDAPPALRAKDQLLLKALRDAAATAPESAATARGLLSLGPPSRIRRLRASRRVGVAAAQLARAAGIATRTAGDRLAVLEKAGLVAAVRTERGRLRGWVLPPGAGDPTSTPAP
jgi:putative DNA primase/helicase